MNILKTAAVAAAGLIALAACQPAAKNTAADETAIKDAARAWATAYNAGDAEGIIALYAEDAVVMPPGAPAATGHAAIREYITADIAAAKAAGVTLAIADNDTVAVSGDLAWHSGSFSVMDASGAVVDTGNYMDASQRVDGNWHIVRDIWNSDRAPAPTPAAEPAAEPTA